jgi:hypothetical protein
MDSRIKLWGFMALVGSLALLILILADREREAGVERLSNWRAPHSEPPVSR